MIRLLVPTLIALLAGLCATFIYLALKPVPQLTAGQWQTASELPRVYWVRGSESPSLDYSRMRRQFAADATGDFSISEGDLNTWLRSELIPALNSGNADVKPVQFMGWTATQPNFRITENHLIFSVLWQNAQKRKYTGHEIIHQIYWRPTPDGVSWELAGGFIGQFPVNALPGLTRLLWARITDNWWDSDLVEPYVESMERMKAIQLQRGRMSFTLEEE